MNRTRTADDGFTLVELLISISIIVIIMSAITSSMIVFLRTGSEASERNDHSGGANLLATYLDRDTASASAVVTTTRCPSSLASGESVVLTLRWAEYTASPTAPLPTEKSTSYYASYVLRTDTAPTGDNRPRLRLQREYCQGPTAGGLTTSNSTVLRTTTLVRSLLATPVPVSATTTAVDAGCAGKPSVVVALRQYRDDAANPYTFRNCLKARLT